MADTERVAPAAREVMRNRSSLYCAMLLRRASFCQWRSAHPRADAWRWQNGVCRLQPHGKRHHRVRLYTRRPLHS